MEPRAKTNILALSQVNTLGIQSAQYRGAHHRVCVRFGWRIELWHKSTDTHDEGEEDFTLLMDIGRRFLETRIRGGKKSFLSVFFFFLI